MKAGQVKCLESVERQLTPKQAAILAVRELIEGHETWWDWGCAQRDLPPERRVWSSLSRTVAEAARSHGSPSAGCVSTDGGLRISPVKRAQMQGDFLLRLALRCNETVLDRAREWDLEAIILLEGVIRIPEMALASSQGGHSLDEEDELMEIWSPPACRERLLEHAHGVLGLGRAVSAIRQGYFEGYEILFADVAATLGSAQERVHETAALFNSSLACLRGSEVKSAKPVDLSAELGADWSGDSNEEGRLVAFAKSETLGVFGYHDQAERCIRPHVV